MAANDKAKLASEADATAADAEAIFNTVNAMKPDAAGTAKVLNALESALDHLLPH